MARDLLTRILCILLLLSAFGAHRQVEEWQCEGRRCSTTLGRCCCAAPVPYRDGKCADGSGKRAKAGVQLCATGCACVMVMECADDAPQAMTAAAASHVAPLLAVLPTPIRLPDVPALIEAPAFHTDTRGPPSARSAFASPSLRAPPAA